MANTMKVLSKQSNHPTKHDCLIEVGDVILSLDQQFETFCYTEHNQFEFEYEIYPEIIFLSSAVITLQCNCINNIIYKRFCLISFSIQLRKSWV